MLNAFGVVLVVLGAMAALIPVVVGVILHHTDRSNEATNEVVRAGSLSEDRELVGAGR
jgi:hypothetical protein